VWIAAHAVETGATLVSYDSHFEKIIGLKIWQSHTA
jgi:tRNA(fMet)-specific endonuclease VapC